MQYTLIHPVSPARLAQSSVDAAFSDSVVTDRVVVIFLGWGVDHGLVSQSVLESAKFEGRDVVCVYDYRTMEVDDGLTTLLSRYVSIDIVAWSFGVWAAERFFADSRFAVFLRNIHSAVAVNGTPMAVHSRYGIDPRSFVITLRGIGGAGLSKFRERMCGDSQRLVWYEAHLPARSQVDIVAELHDLAGFFADTVSVEFQHGVITWTSVLVGDGDVIFLPEAQRAYWDTYRSVGGDRCSLSTECKLCLVHGVPHLMDDELLAMAISFTVTDKTFN